MLACTFKDMLAKGCVAEQTLEKYEENKKRKKKQEKKQEKKRLGHLRRCPISNYEAAPAISPGILSVPSMTMLVHATVENVPAKEKTVQTAPVCTNFGGQNLSSSVSYLNPMPASTQSQVRQLTRDPSC